jgi:FMN phosphatase YigB (HAD superfamily)
MTSPLAAAPGRQSRETRASDETTRYKAWLVDLDGTLYNASAVRLAMAAELMLGHWRAMARLRVFRREQERIRHETLDGSTCPYRLQLERTARRLNCPCDEIDALVCRWMQHRPGKWLRVFRRRGLLREVQGFRIAGGRTALVSDYPASMKLAALGATSLFETVVAIGEEAGPRWLKPHPAGLLAAAGRLGVEPAECLVLGDRPEVDGEAARNAGMAFRRIG